MPKSSLFGTQPRVLADFGSICQLCCRRIWSWCVDLYFVRNKLTSVSSTTTKKYHFRIQNYFILNLELILSLNLYVASWRLRLSLAVNVPVPSALITLLSDSALFYLVLHLWHPLLLYVDLNLSSCRNQYDVYLLLEYMWRWALKHQSEDILKDDEH